MAPELLPEKTLACLRFADTKEFVARFKESQMGRMLDDEQVRPVVSSLYGVAAEMFGQVQDQVGMSLDELLAVPQGEVCLALIVAEDGSPAIVGMLEAGDRIASAQKLLDRAAEELAKQNIPFTTEMVGGTKLTVYDPPGDEPPAIVLFQKDAVVCFTTQVPVAKEMLARWDGSSPKDRPALAQNRKYTSVMNRCGGAGEDQPQLTWFVDPIEIARTVTRGNFTAQTALALLPALGLDGLQAVGGSMILGAGEFDMVQHMHVLLDSPRAGVLKMLAVVPGDSTPEPWVPNDVANYFTLHWDFGTTYDELTKLVDSFQSPGSTAGLVKQQLSDPLGIDFEKEILRAADSRVTYLSRFEKPARLNSQANLVAFKLKNAAEFKGTLERLLSKVEGQYEKRTFGGMTYYVFADPNDPNRRRVDGEANRERVRLEFRSPEGCVGILGDYLVLSDSASLIERCVTAQSDPTRGLASELDYKLIASKIQRQVGGQKPGMLIFNRPEEGMRMLYDLAQAENTRQALASRSDGNPFFRSLNDAVSKNPLPPFAVFAKYLAPGGGMLVDDETGFHYMAFGLRRK